ncbi:phage tail protein [Cellulosilyticum sp. ST5]|uniref:phage tail protein n=1 Tax=Cellulosilyticum sp. ST5 TaxID=3055805 RepID=UPI003977B623
MVEIEVDRRAMARVERVLRGVPNGSKRAISNATNRAIIKGRTIISRGITKKFTIKSAVVKNTLSLEKSTISRLGGSVTSAAPVTTLISFKTNPNKVTSKRPNMLKVSVKKGSAKPIPGAFIAKTKSGHVGVFKRSNGTRLPIAQLMGPSIPYMAKPQDISDDVKAEMINMFNTRLNHEINRLLNK